MDRFHRSFVTVIHMFNSFGPVPLLLLVLPLVACDTASPHFRGQALQRITVDGSVFDVRVRGTLAEAVRINPQYAPRLGPIRMRAAHAMELASGCMVSRVLGDQAVLVGQLDCPSGAIKK
ncbi:hypothetical protein PhaeoP97_00304 [Phaeobacter porticola]|uniref:Uncharacterized protein n=1 Tax=Phaeobacter porticola TaxID=1844006 RepID=A0A1L3I0W2_9RHOB|nr:hypothetical protein PhaeoP97_00304 [Phaeobacter porticola]